MKTAHAAAPYLGTDEQVEVRVGRGSVTSITATFDGVDRSTVLAFVTGKEELDDLVHDSLMAIRASYVEQVGMEANERLEDSWELALRECWRRVI